MVYIQKKDGTKDRWSSSKITSAIRKSAERVMKKISDEDSEMIVKNVANELSKIYDICGEDVFVPVDVMHHAVESALDLYDTDVAKSYRDYRNYKTDFVHILDEVYKKSQGIRYLGDRDNANTDSALVPTQRSLIYNELNSELYKKFFLNVEERQAMKDGYIYIHDRSARLDTMNCCLFDMSTVMKDGFEMGNVWYNEPKTLDVAFDVMSDIAITAAACQYGGFTMPRADAILAPYAEKSYQKYLKEFYEILSEIENKDGIFLDCMSDTTFELEADKYAEQKVRRDFEQGFQSWEYRFNTVGSSRGDYPFIAISFGIDTSRWGKMASEVCLEVRKKGQGKSGFKKPVLFPKLTFLYDENLHSAGKPMEYLFDCAIECSKKSMYPDFLSLTGEGYIPSMYKKYGKVVSLMGK